MENSINSQIKYLTYTESSSVDPYFNLGYEKYLFDTVRDNEVILYLWQNEKTVVCGRNQNVFKECNLTGLGAYEGRVARRLSGGGAVFHDLGNLNFTFIAKDACYDLKRQLRVIAEACNSFGVEAELTGRNDLTACGKKFSGNAFYKSHGTRYHHGTIMIDVDFEKLSEFLNVDRSKLTSKGISSVKSRVVNLSSLAEPGKITVASMKDALRLAFSKVYGDENLNVEELCRLNPTAHAQFQENQAFFESDEWIYGSKTKFTNCISERFSWGDIEIRFNIKGSVVEQAEVFSDSLIPEFISEIQKLLPGSKYSTASLCGIIDSAFEKYPEDSELPCKDIKNLISKSI